MTQRTIAYPHSVTTTDHRSGLRASLAVLACALLVLAEALPFAPWMQASEIERLGPSAYAISGTPEVQVAQTTGTDMPVVEKGVAQSR